MVLILKKSIKAQPVRDGTKTELIFVLFYDVPFKVLFQSRPSPVPSSIQLSSETYYSSSITNHYITNYRR